MYFEMGRAESVHDFGQIPTSVGFPEMWSMDVEGPTSFRMCSIINIKKYDTSFLVPEA